MKKVIIIFFLAGWTFMLYSQSCLPEGIRFKTQTQIDSFQILYPTCTEIEGNVEISFNNDIVSLQSLNVIVAIGGELLIVDCNELPFLNGLDNLQSIGGALSIVSNDNLLNLSALQNLRTIGGRLTISWNYRLKSLSGIDSINAESIDGIHMIYNDSLSWCAVTSICDYIVNSSASVTLHNAVGCDSVEVVEELCSHISIPEQRSFLQLLAYPNPFTTTTTIEFELKGNSKFQISIYNAMGALVYQSRSPGPSVSKSPRHKITWSPGHLPAGLYYGVLRSGDGVSVVKMLKE
ncbi:MAG: T9SS type A sorting domain-containing protein [Bacteroidales bacterium]|nr:T9SS type A sorting domain-containing protein [Bacteroidales bacterium]